MYVRKSEIVLLDMTIEDGAKLIISAGLVAPEVEGEGHQTMGAPALEQLGNPAQLDVAQPARSSRTASSRPNR